MRGIVFCLFAATCQATFLLSETLSDPNLAASFSQSVGGILQAAQAGLSRAERHQEKAVQRVRKDIETTLMSKAQTMGELLGSFSLALQQANQDLLSAVNASKAAIKSADAATPPDHAHDWTGPVVEAKSNAEVGVEVAVTDARNGARHSRTLVREAKSTAEMALEDHAEELSRRVGDVTSSVDAAKAKLETTMDAVLAPGLPTNGTTAVHSTAKKDDVVARMAEVANFIKAAQASSKAKIATAKNKVDAGIAKADKELATKVKDMVMNLVAKEHTELQKLHAQAAKAGGFDKLRGAKKSATHERASVVSKPASAKKVVSKVNASVGKKLKSTL